MEIKLAGYNSELWELLHGAYGNVCEEVKILMGDVEEIPPQEKTRRLDFEEKDDYMIAFDNLCENLTHQMTFYSASYIVMPYMVELLRLRELEGCFKWQFLIICNMGICLATDVYEDSIEEIPGEVLENYNASVEILKEKTKEFIKNNSGRLKELDRNEKNFLATAVLAILADKKAAHILCLGGWEETEISCPECDAYLGLFGFPEEEGLKEDEKEEGITPVKEEAGETGSEESSAYKWYKGFLQDIGAYEEAEIISAYYKKFRCNKCGARKTLMEFAQAIVFYE